VPAHTNDRIKDVNERYHDQAADSYDSKWGIDFGRVGQDQVAGKLRKALGGWPDEPFGDALEIGAGTGYFSLNLLQAGAIERATATDISPGMLATLEGNASRLGLEVSTAAAEAETLPFADESFDLVFGHAVLHHIPDLGQAFSEFARVLRPGGTLTFCGEPSRYGDFLAAIPKRTALLAAPLWRRAVGASPRRHYADADANGHSLEPEVDVHSFSPVDLRGH
jgi:ubiquinone/menaquinone biosynthesis C-methylase UbiE